MGESWLAARRLKEEAIYYEANPPPVSCFFLSIIYTVNSPTPISGRCEMGRHHATGAEVVR